MDNKNIYIYVNWSGQKIKTSGLTMNKNSTNNILNIVTIGHYATLTATFKTPDGKLSNAYHLIDNGKYTLTADDAQYEVLSQNADNLYLYTLQIPYRVTSMLILGTTQRLNVSLAGFNYDDDSKFLKQTMVANTTIIVNDAVTAETLDESYSGADVENLWKAIGELTARVNELENS